MNYYDSCGSMVDCGEVTLPGKKQSFSRNPYSEAPLLCHQSPDGGRGTVTMENFSLHFFANLLR